MLKTYDVVVSVPVKVSASSHAEAKRLAAESARGMVQAGGICATHGMAEPGRSKVGPVELRRTRKDKERIAAEKARRKEPCL